MHKPRETHIGTVMVFIYCFLTTMDSFHYIFYKMLKIGVGVPFTLLPMLKIKIWVWCGRSNKHTLGLRGTGETSPITGPR